MFDSENVSEYSSESGNDGIGGFSESDLESGYLNKSCQEMKLGSCQYEPLKKNSSSENHLEEEEKGNEIVASQSENHRVRNIGWCSCENCQKESTQDDCLCSRKVDRISD